MSISDFDTWFEVLKVKEKNNSTWINDAAYKNTYLLELFRNEFEDCWREASEELKRNLKDLKYANEIQRQEIEFLNHKLEEK